MEAAQAALGRAGSSAQGAGPSSQRAGPSSQGAGPSSQAAPVLATVNEENALPSDDEDE